MTFQEADKKLKRLAKGKYRSLNFELSTHESGEQLTRCSIYIDGETIYSGYTWKEAFTARKTAKTRPTTEEIPEVEV